MTEPTPSAPTPEMAPIRAGAGPASMHEPVESLDDPRALQILQTEHWSLLSARSLAYNEAFTRAGMFLAFLSASLVALALLAQGMSFSRDFLLVAAIVLGFDLVIGLATFFRVNGANSDDLRVMHGMSRIRHGYIQIAPVLTPYFTTPIYDDVAGVMVGYYDPPEGGFAGWAYALSTSLGTVGLIVSLIGGVTVGVVSLAAGGSAAVAIVAGAIGAVVVFGALAWWAAKSIRVNQASLPVMFPSPDA